MPTIDKLETNPNDRAKRVAEKVQNARIKSLRGLTNLSTHIAEEFLSGAQAIAKSSHVLPRKDKE